MRGVPLVAPLRLPLGFPAAPPQRLEETPEDLQRTEIALREEIHRLDQKIEATKADIIKWAFGFWIGNVAVLTGIMLALLRTFAAK